MSVVVHVADAVSDDLAKGTHRLLKVSFFNIVQTGGRGGQTHVKTFMLQIWYVLEAKSCTFDAFMLQKIFTHFWRTFSRKQFEHSVRKYFTREILPTGDFLLFVSLLL